MPLNGKFLDKSGLTYLWSKLKDLFSGKVDKETGKGLSTNDYTTSEKTKLNGIETGANKTIVDSAMSSSSTNPVQNKVINTALAGKQNVLTFDSTPTQSSANPVTSGGIYTDQQRQETEIGVVANTGAKNLLDVQRPTTTTRTSYAPLANGGVELSCSNATWTSYAIANIPVEVGKEYIITFLLDESIGTSNFYFFLRNGDSSGTNLATKNYGSTTGNYEVSFTPSNSVIWLGIYLNNSATAATATAKLRCMIRPAAITDSTFVPYGKTNRELTVAEDEDRAALAEVIDGGAAGTKNHCTLASGSNTPPARWINIPVSDVGAGQWVMSFGTLTSTDIDDTLCQATCFNSSNKQVSNWVNFKREPNTNKTFTITDTVSYVRLYPANSYATSEGDTVTFTDAMLSQKVLYDADPSYVPYAPALTNIILTPAAIKAVDEGSKNKFTYGDLIGITTNFSDQTFSLPAGSYKLIFTASASTGSFAVRLKDAQNNSIYYITADNIATTRTYDLNISEDAAKITFYSSVSNDFTNIMICTSADYAISPAFVPYAPTNRELWQKINAIKRTYKVPISSTPINGIYFGVQMFPFEFDSVPEGTVAVQNIGQGGTAIDPTKFKTQINTWGFRIYTTDSAYAGLIPDVKIL